MIESFPKSVKVGYLDYSIEQWNPKTATANNRYGECSHGELAIRIDTSHDPREVAETLLHEIVHTVARSWGLGKDDSEERIVSAISTGVATIFRDNPTVARFITETLATGQFPTINSER